MPRPRADALLLGARFRLAQPHAPRGGFAGERLGRGPGASLEFEDRRAYAPGDDVRHLDWAAYARTDQLQVRLHREEVVPRLDLVLDASASMAVDAEKAQACVDWTAFLLAAARSGGWSTRLLRVADEVAPLDPAQLAERGVELDGTRPLAALLPAVLPLLRRRAFVLLLSDFLFPHDPAELVRPLQARAGPLVLLQLLSPFDADPPQGAAARLTDAESGAALDVVLDDAAVARYRARSAALRDGLATECRRAAATFLALRSDVALEAACRTELLPRGIVAAN